jgi:hypothetical protein
VRVCTVCKNSRRVAIDSALARGQSERTIAERFRLSHSAVHRHRVVCVAWLLSQHREAAEVASAATLGKEMRALLRHVGVLRNVAEERGDLRFSLRALDSAMKGLEILARLSGMIDSSTKVTVAVSQTQGVRGMSDAAIEDGIAHCIAELAADFLEKRGIILTGEDRTLLSSLSQEHEAQHAALLDKSMLTSGTETSPKPQQRAGTVLPSSQDGSQFFFGRTK